ncbi:MAG: SRPBCC domain-containing protein [Anaerolineae bacterium]
MSDRQITDSVVIHASPQIVYNALTTSTQINQWLCNHADVHYRAAEGSGFYLGWNDEYQVIGKFITLEPGKRVAMTWCGAGEPETRVEFTLTPEDGGTRVTMAHTGYGENDAKLLEDHRLGWQGMLECLKYFVETGLDLRLMRRPMLGIFLGPLTPERREALGVPVDYGIVIDGTMEGLGARKAGIQGNDVITEINGHRITGINEVSTAIRGKVGGDVVSVTFYRHADAHTVSMELGKRPAPDVPPTAAELAARQLEGYDRQMGQIKALVKDLPESALNTAPAENEWSVNENLAHLIWSERCAQIDIWNAHGGGFGYDWPNNGPLHLVGVLAACPTSADLIAELQRSFTATIAILKSLTPEDADVKTTYARIGQICIGQIDHTNEHIDQITRTIEQVQANAAPIAK